MIAIHNGLGYMFAPICNPCVIAHRLQLTEVDTSYSARARLFRSSAMTDWQGRNDGKITLT